MIITAEKRAFWSKHQQDWQASGVTQRAYCQREGLGYSTFGAWRQRLNTDPIDQSAQPASLPKPRPSPQLTMVPVNVAAPRMTVELCSPGGWQVQLPGSIDLAGLAHLLRQLP
jgi:hypothetical protein